MIYAKEGDVIARDSEKADIDHIAENMRIDDINEIWSSHHRLPKEALEKGFKDSLKCITVLKEDTPIIMFGLVPDGILGKSAVIWMLSTNDLKKIQVKFIKYSRCFIDIFLGLYPFLYNYVSDDNKLSIKWLRYCKAKMNGCVTYGVEKKQFHPFMFDRYRR